MKRNLIVIVIAALVTLAIPAVCSATPPHPGPYVSGFLGVNVLEDTDVTSTDFSTAPPVTINDRVEFDPSINIGGTGGFDFGFVRLEGELSYKHGEISAVNDQTNGIRYVDTDGRLGALAMMANAFFDLHNPSPITPYIGGGIGFAALHVDDTFGTDATSGLRTLLYFDDDDAVFAYQAGAGLEIALNRMLSLDLGYRYFATDTARFDSSPVLANLKFKSHNGAVGIRVKFF